MIQNRRERPRIRILAMAIGLCSLMSATGCLSILDSTSSGSDDRAAARERAELPPARPLDAQGRLIPDRRPVRAITCFNGNPRHPWRLHDGWGVEDDEQAIAWLQEELERGLSEGYTRFSLTLPGGRDPDARLFASSQWVGLSKSRQRALARFCRQWLNEHPHTTLGLYSGFDIDPTPETIEFSGHRPPKINSAQDRQQMLDRTMPWVEQCGFYEVWWDATSGAARRPAAKHYAKMMMERGIRVGGEAMPRHFGKSREYELVQEDIETMPWVALVVYYDRWDPDWTWTVDPETTELFIAIRPGDPGTDEQLESYFRRGFIPWVHGRKKDDRVMPLWRQTQRELAREGRR